MRRSPALRSLLLVVALLCSAASAVGTPTVTVTPTAVMTLTATESTTASSNVTVSETDSIPLPVFTPYVLLRSPAILNADCIITEIETEVARQCRTMVFEMFNDGFQFNSQVYSFLVKNRVIYGAFGDELNPFGIAATLDDFRNRMTVFSNTSHLTIQLPRSFGLVVSETTTLQLNFSLPEVPLRGEAPTWNSSYDIVIPPFSDYSESQAMLVVQTMAGIAGGIAALSPTPASIIEAQVALLSAQTHCMQPDIRKVAIHGRRFVHPSAEVDSDASTLLAHNAVMILTFTAVHLVAVIFTMARMKWGFWRAAATVYFPSLSYSLIIFLHAGTVHASFTLLVGRERDNAGQRVAGFVGMIYSIVLVLVTPILARIFFHGEYRTYELQLYDFPGVLRAFMPEGAWGPQQVTGPWQQPIGAIRGGRLPMTAATLAYTTVVAAVLAVEPPVAATCGLQYIIVSFVIMAYVAFLMKFQPYRSRMLCAATAINAVFTVFPMFAATHRCFTEEHPLNGGIWVMYVVVYGLSFIRSCGNLIATAFENQMVRPKVWLEDKNLDFDLDHHMQQRTEVKARPYNAHLISEELIEAAEKYDASPTRVRVQAGLVDFSYSERERCVLGEPAPLPPVDPPRVRKQTRNLTKIAMTLRHPIANLMLNDGPVPPQIQAQRESEYSVL